MDRSTTDDAVDVHGSSDLAVADLPSTSGAHWANRDQDMLDRRSAGRPAPFRRPPAVNSFPGEDDGAAALSPSAYLPLETEMPQMRQTPGTRQMPDSTLTPQGEPDGGWFSGHGGDGYAYADADRFSHADTDQWPAPEPEFGPAPPATPGRTSFGVTAGPISPSGRSAAAPTSPAHSYSPPAVQPGDFGTGGHEIRPHRASRHDPPAHEQTGSNLQYNPGRGQDTGQNPVTPYGEKPRRSRTVVVATVALAVLVLLGGAASGMMFYAGNGGKSGDKTITASLDGRTAATFELVAATTKVTVKAQDLGDDLYRITTVDDTAPSAVVSADRVQLHLNEDGTNADGQVQVLLSSKVRWALRFVGGADEQIVDLSGGRVSALEVLGGSRRLQVVLPTPTGTVPISVTGSVEDFSITAPKNSPVRVKVDSGANTVAAGQRTLRNVRPGSTLTPTDWNTPNRYDVDAAARLTLLSVTVPK